jgi:succinate dehydrogenase / fumarate reductase iron-sulfur subunit
MEFRIYRYHPETDRAPRMRAYVLDRVAPGTMVRDALLRIRAEQDETLTFRHSCGEGVCGSDAMNINGRNALACTTPVAGLHEPVQVRPLPGQPVIRDLVVDLTRFFQHYRAVKPWLAVRDPAPESEFRQSPEERDRLDGLYECILCACCSTACPSWWWNPEKFRGPAALLQACRFLLDSRDQAMDERLAELDGAFRLFRCHTIMSCVEACPKGLNPTRAIGLIKALMLRRGL